MTWVSRGSMRPDCCGEEKVEPVDLCSGLQLCSWAVVDKSSQTELSLKFSKQPQLGVNNGIDLQFMRDYISCLVWEQLGCPGKNWKTLLGGDIWNVLLRQDKDGWRWGWFWTWVWTGLGQHRAAPPPLSVSSSRYTMLSNKDLKCQK